MESKWLEYAAYLQAKHLPNDQTPMAADYAEYLIVKYGTDEDRRRFSAPQVISDEELRHAVEQASEFVRQLAREGKREFAPLLKILHRRTFNSAIEHSIVQVSLPDGRDERDVIFYALGRKFARDPKGTPVGIVFHTEAWMVLAPSDGKLNSRPSKHPERVECVTISGLTIDGRVCAIMHELRRRGKGPLVLVQHKAMAMKVTSLEEPNGYRPLMLLPFFQGVLEAVDNQ